MHIACADDFISDLEDGIDTLLGERGTGLSEGQMQRIAIARALFSESPILLLDESTSALDGETEKTLLGNLRSMTDKTVVIVTHRPAALDICDRVLRFTEKGIEEYQSAAVREQRNISVCTAAFHFEQSTLFNIIAFEVITDHDFLQISILPDPIAFLMSAQKNVH